MRKPKGEKVIVTFSRSIFARKTTRIIVAVLVIGAMISYPLFQAKKIKAEEAIFYPENCTGSWSNATAVSGAPVEDSDGLSIDVAQATGSGQEIICTDFNGELPDGANIVKAELELVWSIGRRTIILEEAPIEESFDPAEPSLSESEKSEESTGEEIIETEEIIEAAESEEAESEEIIEEIKTPEEKAPVIDTEPESMPEVLPPTSWLNKIFALEAQAQEETTLETSGGVTEGLPLDKEAGETILSEEESLEEQVLENQAEFPTEALDSTPVLETEAVVSNPIQGTVLFDLSYGLNESPWQAIGQVERERMTERYSVPLTYEDISALKISLISRMTLDGVNDIFLEAVKLVITHDGVTVVEVSEGPDLLIDTLIDEVSDDRYWAVLIKREKNKHYEIWYTDSIHKEKLLPFAKRLTTPRSVLEAAIDFLTPESEILTEVSPEISQVVEPVISTTIKPSITVAAEPIIEVQKPAVVDDTTELAWNFVAGSDLVDEYSSLKFQDDLIFWLAKENNAIYIFNPLTQSLNSQSYDIGSGDNFILYKGASGEDKKAIFDFPSRRFDFSEIEQQHEE